MANISFPAEKSPVFAKPSFSALVNIADQFWALVTPRSGVAARRDEAIAILREGTASPEEGDGAER